MKLDFFLRFGSSNPDLAPVTQQSHLDQNLGKRDSKSVTIVVYREEERQPVECHLQFPLLQCNQFKALCLYAVCMPYAGWEYTLPALTLNKLQPFLQMVVTIATRKLVTDIQEMGILLLSVVGSGNMAPPILLGRISLWIFLVPITAVILELRSGASLWYLVRKDDDPEQEEIETFTSIDQFLLNAMSYKSGVNLAFSDENQAPAGCLAKALGPATKQMSDLLALTSKGFGHLAWVKLHYCIMGSVKATHARLSRSLRTPTQEEVRMDLVRSRPITVSL
jgi:hypothetical protein